MSISTSTTVSPLPYLSKAALSDDFEHFVSISDVIMRNEEIAAVVIIVATVVRRTDDPS